MPGLQLAASLITSGSGVKLLHVTLGGFDTHQTELSRHNDLMGYLDQSVSAFYQDLSVHGMADKVLVATWSEFSRRPQENASGGTDHGAAAAMLLIGNNPTDQHPLLAWATSSTASTSGRSTRRS